MQRSLADASRPISGSSILLGSAALVAGGCSGTTFEPPTEPPALGAAVVGSTQDRTFDPSGRTIVVTFEDDILAADAENEAYYRISGATVDLATLTAPDTVRLSVDRVVVPGDRVLDVLPGIRDQSGQVSPGASARAIDSTDVVEPDASRIAAVTVSGADNDQIVIVFDDDMVESEVETALYWAVESPVGTPVDLTSASIVYDGPQRTATLTLGGGQNLTTSADVAAVFTTMRDIGGNVVRITAFGVSAVSSVVAGDVTPPQLISAAPGATAGTLRLVFDEPVQFVSTSDLVASPGTLGSRIFFEEAGAPGVEIHATSSSGIVDGFGAEAGFAVTPEAGDLVTVVGIADLAGNVIEPVIDAPVVARDPVAPALFSGSTVLTAIEGEMNDVMSVTFDRAMHPEALFTDNRYGLLYDFFVNTGGAAASWNGTDTVTFVLEGPIDHEVQSGSGYILAVAGLMSAQGVPIDVVTQESSIVAGGDSTAASVVSSTLDPTRSNAVIVTFSEAMNGSRMVDLTSYVLPGRTTTEAAALGPRVVRVAFNGNPSIGEMLEVTANGQTDRAGNAGPSTATIALTSADLTPPTIASAAGTTVPGDANDVVEVIFSESVDPAAATDATNYTLTNGGVAIDLEGASLRYVSSTTSVRVALGAGEHLTTGATLSASAAGIDDSSGNALAGSPATATIAGDSLAPSTLAAFVNYRAAANGSVIEVTAPEALGTSADLALNWSASGGPTVVQVKRMSTTRHRVTLDGPLGAGDTLTLTGAVDHAGNAAAGPIAVDPLE